MTPHIEETWNPKTKEFEKIEIRPYDFEDWQKGCLPKWNLWNVRLHDTKTGKIHIDKLVDITKINQAQKKLYNQVINELLKVFREIFETKFLEKSEDPEVLVRDQINFLDQLFDHQKLTINQSMINRNFQLGPIFYPTKGVDHLLGNKQKSSAPLPLEQSLSTNQIKDIRKAYQAGIVKGEKPYQNILNPDGFVLGANRNMIVLAEVFFQFRKYLRHWKPKRPTDSLNLLNSFTLKDTRDYALMDYYLSAEADKYTGQFHKDNYPIFQQLLKITEGTCKSAATFVSKAEERRKNTTKHRKKIQALHDQLSEFPAAQQRAKEDLDAIDDL